MKSFGGSLEESNFLNDKLLRRIFIVSVLLSFALPLSFDFVIYPTFEEFFIEDKKDDALHIAEYLGSLLPKNPADLARDNIPVEVTNEIEKYRSYFGLTKIKFYSRNGKTIFSTHEEDIGTSGREKFFREFLSKRQIYTQRVRKDNPTAEGEKLSFDVIETYVPLFNDNTAIGVLEVYYDTSERLAQLDALELRSRIMLYGFSSLLLVIITLVLIKEYKSILKRRQAEEALQGHLQFSQQLIDTIPNPVFYKDLKATYLGCNAAFEKLVGRSKDEIIGKTVYEIAHTREWGDIYSESDEQLFKQTGTQVYETAIKGADGSMHDVIAHKATYHDVSGAVVGLVGVLTDITELKLTEEALRASENKLHVLSSHLLSVQEEERRLLSLELHDELGQSLMLLKLQLKELQRRLREDQEELRNDTERILLYVEQVIENARRLSRDLSPAILGDLGLSAAIRSMADDFTTHSPIRVSCDIEEVDDFFPLASHILIYRIFQESLTNIVKHSQSREAYLAIKGDKSKVILIVEDYGKGFDINEVAARYSVDKGLGLAAIEERARMLGGSLTISSSKGKGTRLTVAIPAEISGGIPVEPLSYSTG